MACPCKKNGSTAVAKKFTVVQQDGSVKTFTNEADAKLSAAKNGTRVKPAA